MSTLNKTIVSKIVVLLFFVAFVVLYFQRDNLQCLIAKYQLLNSNVELNYSDTLAFMQGYNNSHSNRDFELSLIELGANGCIPCRKMDTVLVEIKEIYKEKLNIQIFNITKDDGKKAAKYFELNAIPVQIILNIQGKEVFRHIGFLSTEDLQTKIDELLFVNESKK